MNQGRKRYYILVGDTDTWKTAIRHELWGFSDRSRGLWNTANIGDYLAFYVISPVKKIIGFGIITNKYIDNRKIWPDEILFDRPIWNYRFKFRTFHVLGDWKKGIAIPNNIILNVGRKKIEEDLYYNIVSKAEGLWKRKIMSS